MRGMSTIEVIYDSFLKEIGSKSLDALALEYDLSISSLLDVYRLNEKLEKELNNRVFESKELREERVSHYRVTGADVTRFYFSNPIVILGSSYMAYVDIQLLGNHKVNVSSFGVEPILNILGASIIVEKNYTLAEAIEDQQDRVDNYDIRYNMYDDGFFYSEKDIIASGDDSDKNDKFIDADEYEYSDDEYEDYSDDFVVFK